MISDNRTVVGIFSDLTDAKRAADALHAQGISTARLIENELAVTFTGTAEREGASSSESVTGEPHKTGGLRGFFARLFGFEDHRSDWSLSEDSESYFRNAYDKKNHLVVIEDCADVTRCRDIISRLGGVAEEQGGHYYQTEKGRSGAVSTQAQDPRPSSDLGHTTDNALPIDRDESLDSGRRSAVDHAADSGLGVDVDRMPFAHAGEAREPTVSDRLAQSGLSGTADRIPFAAASDHDRNRSASPGSGFSPDAVPGTGRTVPAERSSLAGSAVGDSLLISAEQKGPPDILAHLPFHGDRALNGISGDADRTPLVGERSHADPNGTVNIVRDDRVHDHGVSNADVARTSSDRIMELDEDSDQHLVDAGMDEGDESPRPRDNGHILPDRSYPPSPGA